MEFTTEQFGQASREVFSGSVSQTEEIIEKHMKVMDKLDKKKKDVLNIIAKGEKLAEMPKAPPFLGEKLSAMKKLWNDTNNIAKQRLDDLKVSKFHDRNFLLTSKISFRLTLDAGIPLLKNVLCCRLRLQQPRSKLMM